MNVLEVVPKDTPQVLLSDHDDVVEAVPPKGPDHAEAAWSATIGGCPPRFRLLQAQ
ncbi:MAG: hypothetical protein WCE62_14860 [Polyangiales bacterium]